MLPANYAAFVLIVFCLILISTSIVALSNSDALKSSKARPKSSPSSLSMSTPSAAHDDVTLQLSKNEAKEHQGTHEMKILFDDMSSRDVIVCVSTHVENTQRR